MLQSGPSGSGTFRRQVVVDELDAGALEGALTRAGFQAQNLSVWLLQVRQYLPIPPLSASTPVKYLFVACNQFCLSSLISHHHFRIHAPQAPCYCTSLLTFGIHCALLHRSPSSPMPHRLVSVCVPPHMCPGLFRWSAQGQQRSSAI